MPVTLNTLPSSPLPDLPIKVSVAYKTRTAEFGDGYEQVGSDTVNAAKRKVTLTWSRINNAERDVLVPFFEQHPPTVPFYYTAPNRAQRPYRCTGWSDTEIDAGYYTITATLEEYHGVT